MLTILFTAPAGVFDFNKYDPDTGDAGLFVDSEEALRMLDGLAYKDECFSDYLGDGDETRNLKKIGIEGGFLEFSFDDKDKHLLACTKYLISRFLSEKEIDLLKEYTIGQWSDGIGSNFFRERMIQGLLAPQVIIMNDEVVRIEQCA